MIIIIKTNKESLHDLEFVKPIEKILKNNNIKFITKHYRELTKNDLLKADKVIICGTSLKDNEFIKDIKYFNWIKYFKKPILGICAGMQIIGLVFNGKLKKKTEIGATEITFRRKFLGFGGKKEVYELHNYYIDFSKLKDFEVFAKSSIAQAVKHKEKEIYAVLFHPEVRNEEIIVNFIL
jgi:GMP synthase (glutamine-hydrolysing)